MAPASFVDVVKMVGLHLGFPGTAVLGFAGQAVLLAVVTTNPEA